MKRHQIVAHPDHEVNGEGITKKSYKCNLCGVLFSRQANLNRHLKRKHKTDENVALPQDVYPCELCDKEFKKKYHLLRHVRVKHEALKGDELKCKVCGKSFTRVENLKRHMTVHNSDSGLKCDHCEIKFSQKVSLERHKKGAFDEDSYPKFPCQDCDKFFCTGKAMKAHNCYELMLKEKYDLPSDFICDKCYEVFTSRRALNVHVKASIELSCKQCSMDFCNFNSLKKHIFYIHEMESTK